MRLQERQKHGLAKWAYLLNISVQIMRWWLHRLSRDVENWILPHKLPQRVHLSWFQSPITNHHVYSTFLGERIIDEIATFSLVKKIFQISTRLSIYRSIDRSLNYFTINTNEGRNDKISFAIALLNNVLLNIVSSQVLVALKFDTRFWDEGRE